MAEELTITIRKSHDGARITAVCLGELDITRAFQSADIRMARAELNTVVLELRPIQVQVVIEHE